MKVLIDGIPNEFIQIIRVGDHWQCNTIGHKSAHNFNNHVKTYPKDTPIKTNGHTYIFPSK
jgi:hypothetical protein